MRFFVNLTRFELVLWLSSILVVTLFFLLFDRTNYMTFVASLIGATSLIFCAKGNPLGQVLIIIFSVLYGIISYSFAYYGEMITYIGMSAPMAVASLISWLKNPFEGNGAEVAVNRLKRTDCLILPILTVVVTVIMYFVLKYFDTANLLPSTISVTTTFAAVYLTFRRSALYAIAYAANDAVLIVLWILAAIEDISYISLVACFCVFLVNDIYGFISWRKMTLRQRTSGKEPSGKIVSNAI